MDFKWDERKRQKIIENRGVDILYAALIFDGVVLTKTDERADYGERREISLGMVDGECFVVVHTERNNAIRLITEWKGGQREIAQYKASIAAAAKKIE